MDSPAINEAIFEDPDASQEAVNHPFDNDTEAESDERILKEIRENIKKSKDYLNDWYVEARLAFDYFAGNQWTEEDRQKLNDERRPAIVFNRIPRVINAIAGLQIENRQELIYTPRTQGAAMASEILTGAADFVRDNCDAEDEETQAFKDSLQCGMGWVETRLDFDTELDGQIVIERVDPLEMAWDVTAKKRNLSDAAWIAREKVYSKKEFRSIWPDAELDLANSSTHPHGIQPHDATIAPWYIIDQSSKDQREKDKVRVIQYQKWVRVPFYRVQDPNDIVELSVTEFKKMRKYIEAMGYKYIKQFKKVYKQYFVAGEQVLEKGDSPVNAFTFRAITGMSDRNRNYWFGMISIMKDPQQWANKWLSQTMHIFNTNAKGGYFAESGAFKDARQAERTISQNSITYVNEGVLVEGRITPKTPQQFPQGLDSLLQYAVGSVSELVGVSLESLGQEKTDISGVLAAERKRTTITIVADFFDALRRYRKEQGRVLADFIIDYLSDGRLIRIAGQGLGEYVSLVKDELDFPYDIVMDESPTSPNQKERTFGLLVQLLPTLMEAGIPIPPEILDYAPLPPSLVRQWQELINTPPDNSGEEMKEQMRLLLAQLEAANKEQDVKNKQAQEIETQTKAALNIAKMGHEHTLAVRDVASSHKEDFRKDMEVGIKLAKELKDDGRSRR